MLFLSVTVEDRRKGWEDFYFFQLCLGLVEKHNG